VSSNISISLMNPRTPYTVLLLVIGSCGFTLAWWQLSDASSPLLTHSLGGIALFAATALFCIRIVVLYLLPKSDWKIWAAQHGGCYSYPPNMFIQPYGNVLDLLQSIDDTTGQPFVLMRAIQTINNHGYDHNSLASRRWVILAKPSSTFSDSDKDGYQLEIITAKHYYLHPPTYDELKKLGSEYLDPML
jgi:hypothetical protein